MVRQPNPDSKLKSSPNPAALREAFAMVEEWRPDLIVYPAGADPRRHDPLDSLGMTTEQMFERDRIVFAFCREMRLPVLFVLVGGHQEPIQFRLLPVHSAQDCLGPVAATASLPNLPPNP